MKSGTIAQIYLMHVLVPELFEKLFAPFCAVLPPSLWVALPICAAILLCFALAWGGRTEVRFLRKRKQISKQGDSL